MAWATLMQIAKEMMLKNVGQRKAETFLYEIFFLSKDQLSQVYLVC